MTTQVPYGYWGSKENRIAAVKSLAEKCGNELTRKDFHENRLEGLLQRSGGIVAALQDAGFISEFPWLSHLRVPPGYWNEKENRIRAVRWLIKKARNLKADDFKDNGLVGLLKHYEGSPTKALEDAGLSVEKPWLTRHMPKRYWNNRENRIAATKELVKDLGKENVNGYDFEKHGLSGMLNGHYHGSPIAALIDAGFSIDISSKDVIAPKNYWAKIENRIKATKQLVEKLGRRPTQEEFGENGLRGLLKYHGNSALEAFKEAGYDVNNPWLSGYVPNGYWKNKQNRIDAVKWLAEKEGRALSKNQFKGHGLIGLLEGTYRGSVTQALQEAGLIDGPLWLSGCRMPKNFWTNHENRKNAVDWLIKTVGGRRPFNSDYHKYGLAGLLCRYHSAIKIFDELGQVPFQFITANLFGTALQSLIGMEKEAALELAKYILNFFEFDEIAQDSIFDKDDRATIRMLEDYGLVKEEHDEIDSPVGVCWKKDKTLGIKPLEGYRIHSWILNRKKILEAVTIPKSQTLEQSLDYFKLPEEAWKRKDINLT
jgi:hypothetical protein